MHSKSGGPISTSFPRSHVPKGQTLGTRLIQSELPLSVNAVLE